MSHLWGHGVGGHLLRWVSYLFLVGVVLGSCAAPSSRPRAEPTDSASSPSPSPSASDTGSPSPEPSPTATTNWKTYSDSQYGYSIAYPPDFVLKQEGSADPGAGWLWAGRAVDKRNLIGFPRGQIELGIYSRDADAPRAWLEKHSGPAPAGPDEGVFYNDVSNVTQTSVVNREAVAWDWVTQEGDSIHALAFFIGRRFVFQIDWWATDSDYAPTVRDIFEKMIASFKD